MSVLLVNPPLYDYAALDLWAKPLGLLQIGAALRTLGITVTLLDYLDVQQYGPADNTADIAPPVLKKYGTAQYMKRKAAAPPLTPRPHAWYYRYGLSHERAQELLAAVPPPELILITSQFTYVYPGVQDAITFLRRLYPGTPVWLGGIYAQTCPAHAGTHSGADRVVTSTDIVKIAAQVAQQIGYRRAIPAAWHTFAGLPSPALDLYPALRYLPVRTSRGCVNACDYCVAHQLYPQFEERTWQHVADEIETASARFSVKDVALYDDALLVNASRRFVPLLRHAAAQRWPLRFHLPNAMHIHLMTPEIADAMRAAQVTTIRLGMETIHATRVRMTGAKYAAADVARCMQALRAAGFAREMIGMYILVGLPGQTIEEVRATIRCVREEFGVQAKLAEYSPIPGTALWPAAVVESRVPIADEPLWHNNSLLAYRSPVFTPDVLAALRTATRPCSG
ncbi:MAG: radical SAM protein [bacterium]|nr:radical SAM protein [bacterium]